ncbi:hypothetical protein, partial [Burkholderia pseudomallei]
RRRATRPTLRRRAATRASRPPSASISMCATTRAGSA